MKLLKLVLVTLALAAVLAPGNAVAAPNHLFDDPRVVSWSRDWSAGRGKELLASLEKDLKSGSPHPFAAHLWCRAQVKLTQDLPNAVAGADPAVVRALGPYARLHQLYYVEDKPKEVLKSLAAAEAASPGNAWLPMLGLFAASDLERQREDLAQTLVLARAYPDLFVVAWQLVYIAAAIEGDRQTHEAILAAVRSAPLAGTPTQRFVEQIFPHTSTSSALEKLAAVDAFLKERPSDAWAHRYRALQLVDLERHEEAARADERATSLLPAFEHDEIGEWLRVGHDDEARAQARASSRMDQAHPDLEAAYVEVELANGLMRAGERGRAREVLTAALAKWPSEERLQDAMARLELDSDRPLQAVPFARKAVQLSKVAKADYYVRLIDALRRSGKPAEAYAEYARLVASGVDSTPKARYAGSQALEAAERRGEQLTLVEAAVREHPESAWMRRELADVYWAAKRSREALAAANAAFELDPTSRWTINHIVQWTEADAGKAAADATLARMRSRYPWVEQLWIATADRFDGEHKREQALELWNRAIQAEPTRLWPVEQALVVLHKLERFDEAERLVRSTLQRAKALRVGDQTNVLYELPWTLHMRAQSGPIAAASAEEGLRSIEEYRRAGGSASQYHRFRGNMLRALGRKKEAGEALLAYAQAVPDSEDPLWDVFTNFDTPGRWKAANHFLDRDPYAASRLKTVRKLHSYYSGSPIVALYLGSLLRERAPAAADSNTEDTASGKLGDAVRGYQFAYTQATSISNSERYVDWYNSARLKAQGMSTAIGLPFDPASQTRCAVDFARKLVSPGSKTWAVICHDTGEVLVREDEPLTGKLRLLQHGAAFIRFSYDAQGENLTRIDASSGEWMALEYDAKARISRLRQPGKGDITFEYNDRDKPTKISAVGVGELTVTYKADAEEIEKVASPQGRKVALEITSAFQRLLDYIRPASASGAEVVELPHADPKLERLREQVSRAASSFRERDQDKTWRQRLELARYLVDHLGDSRRYPEEAESILRDILDQREEARRRGTAGMTLEAAQLWYRLKVATRLAGLRTEELTAWASLRGWVERQSGGPEGTRAAELLKTADAKPLGLMPTARWLPRSALNTPGPWRHWLPSSTMPASLRGATTRAVLVRRNHDVVVGTSAGLTVLHRGFWGWYGFDPARSRFSATVSYDGLNATSDVLSLAEDDAGVLWIGTATGLVSLTGDYDDGEQRVWRTQDDGLPSPRVEALAAVAGGMFVGTAAGARVIGGDSKVSVPDRLGDQPIVQLASAHAFDEEAPLVVLTPAGLVAFLNGRTRDLVRGTIAGAVYEPRSSTVTYLQGKTLYSVKFVDWPGEGAALEPPRRLPGQQDVVFQQRINGVALMPIDEKGTLAPTVLTDVGLSFFKDDHFEHLAVPGVQTKPGVTAVNGRDGRTFVLTTAGVFAAEFGRENVHRGRVYDLLTLDDLGLTLVARDEGLFAVKHDGKDTSEQLVDSIESTVLARHPKGGWVTNDGLRILRYEPDRSAAKLLFEAAPDKPSEDRLYQAGPIRSILVSSDEAVWVVSGSYLYRFKDGKRQEWSTAIDPDKFPARSEMLSRVIETIDGKIWLIASNEGHIVDRGVVLMGGVLEWTGKGWKRLELPEKTNGWFMRSYTALDKTTAITGTTYGFGRHRAGRLELLSTLGDPSYKRMLDHNPQLFLGTRGAKLGSIWLFGTAGGVVALKDGTWFIPDRLNWMLPDQGLSAYGARHVHALETDRRGRVYVATDRGLLIYDSGGGDAASFLLTNDMEAEAFRDAAADQLQRESDVLLGNLSKGSVLADRIARVQELRKGIEALKARRASGEGGSQLAQAQGASRPTDASRPGQGEQPKEDEALRAKEKELNTLLVRIESETPGLYQMLDLKPVDLASLGNRLGEDQVIVQYLPTDKRLFVQIVTKTSREVREVEVDRGELMSRALHAASRLGARPSGSMRGFVVANVVEQGQPPLAGELAWLYGQLLRPIERDITGKKYVYVVPVGALTYLPFAALISQQKPKVEYAVERFTFGYLTSLYMFDLMLRPSPEGQGGAFVLGDPDGSLPGARAEASVVASVVKDSKLRLGSEATYRSLIDDGPGSRMLHLATHGLLDHERPERSALLLADDVLLTVPDAMTLRLGHTDLVVLSACETGIGRSGLEYATLARAFMNAGASTVLATLWRVDDAASKQLIESFYKATSSGEDRLTALANAQRQMIKAEGASGNPSKWASYIAFGKR